MDHRLLVPGQVAAQPILCLEERLPDSGHVPVTEDCEDSAEERLLDPVEARVLLRQELNERLCHRQASGTRHGDRLLRTL